MTSSVSIDAGQYVFVPSVAVETGRRYWIYTDTWSNDSLLGFDVDHYPGGDGFASLSPAVTPDLSLRVFRKSPASGMKPVPGVFVDQNFRLVGIAK